MNDSECSVKALCLQRKYIVRAKDLCQPGKRIILALAGAPGSGKSTVARLLHEALPDISTIVPMDGFHLSNRELECLGRKERKGAPDTFDVWGYRSLLKRIKHQKEDENIYAPKFYRTIEEPIAGSIRIDYNKSLIITEGNYLLLSDSPWNSLTDLFDERWYIQAPVSQRKQRLVNRHHFFGRSIEEARAWVENTDEPNAKLIEKDSQPADLVLNWKNPNL